MRRSAALATIVAAFLLAGCAGGRPAQRVETGRVTAALGQDGVQRASVVGYSYGFVPSTLVVKAKVPVELSLTERPDVVSHSFVIKAPEAGIDVDVDLATEPKTVRFTAAKAGTWAYYCDEKEPSSASHRERGMEGVLVVEE